MKYICLDIPPMTRGNIEVKSFFGLPTELISLILINETNHIIRDSFRPSIHVYDKLKEI